MPSTSYRPYLTTVITVPRARIFLCVNLDNPFKSRAFHLSPVLRALLSLFLPPSRESHIWARDMPRARLQKKSFDIHRDAARGTRNFLPVAVCLQLHCAFAGRQRTDFFDEQAMNKEGK